MIESYRKLAFAVLKRMVDDAKAELSKGYSVDIVRYHAYKTADVWFHAAGINREWFYEKLEKEIISRYENPKITRKTSKKGLH